MQGGVVCQGKCADGACDAFAVQRAVTIAAAGGAGELVGPGATAASVAHRIVAGAARGAA